MQIADIMSTPAVTVREDATLHEAIGTMLDERVGSVVVVEAGPAGILTRSDCLRAAYHVGGALDGLPVTRAMSTDLVTTTPGTSLRKGLGLMEVHEVKKLPVVDDLELVGVVTMTDIARHLPERVREVGTSLERKDEWTD